MEHCSLRLHDVHLQALDKWTTVSHFAQAYLLVVNFFLALKTATNLLAFLSNSTSLIVDYNGLILFNGLFRLCLVLLNLLVFASSLVCLLALMLTLKHSRLRKRIIQGFTISQILLASLTMLLMGRLWLAPVKLNLQDALPSWRKEIKYYNYKLAPGASGPRLASSAGTFIPVPSSVSTLYGQIRSYVTNGDYETKVMRRQKAGIWATSTVEGNYNEPSPEQSQPQDYSVESDSISWRTTNSASYIHPTTTTSRQRESPEPGHGRLLLNERGLGTSTSTVQLVPAHEPHNYLRALDRLQQALECCGVESPHDWAKYNERLGLLAPSCCKHPRAIKVSGQFIDQGSRQRINASEMATDPHQWSSSPLSETVNRKLKVSSPRRDGSRNKETETSGGEDKAWRALDASLSSQEETVIYFCPPGHEDPGAYLDGLEEHQDKGGGGGGATVDTPTGQTASGRPLTKEELLELQLASEWTNSHPNYLHLNQHKRVIPIVYGCQRTLDGRDSRFLFGLRLSLLILVALLFLNIIAQSAAFEGKWRRMGNCRGPGLAMGSSGMAAVQVTCHTRRPRLELATANNTAPLPTPQRQTSNLNSIMVPSGGRPIVVAHG